MHMFRAILRPGLARRALGAAVASTTVATAFVAQCDPLPSAIAGITEHGEVTLEALVGRSLDHLTETTGTVTIRGLEVPTHVYLLDAVKLCYVHCTMLPCPHNVSRSHWLALSRFTLPHSHTLAFIWLSLVQCHAVPFSSCSHTVPAGALVAV